MADRLAELRRQRVLISEHLAWLDREITQGDGSATDSKVASPTQPPASAANVGSPLLLGPAAAATVIPTGLPTANPSLTTASVPVAADADRLLDEFRLETGEVKNDVRKGCLLYFVAAFVLVGAAFGILYLTIGSR